MNFEKVSNLFEKLEKTSKRLEKIITLRDFLTENKKEAPLIFDIISGNYLRESNKKTIATSLKTLFSIIAFISKSTESQVEKKFNKIGDIGEVAVEFLKEGKQASLLQKELTLQDITQSFETISKTSGTNKNKIKKEILAKLFLNSKTDTEYKFLARLLIDDLRVGVSEGVLRDSCVNALFPKIIDIQLICGKCKHVNLNSKKCFNCSETLDLKNQEEIVQKQSEFKIIEIGTPKEIIGLDEFIGEKSKEETLKFALRLNPKTHIIKSQNPRELYNMFTEIFEKKYNTMNSFQQILAELKKDLQNVIKVEIEYGKPIKSMLGVRSNTIKDSFDVSGKPAILDYKYDGLRVQIHKEKQTVKLFSRNLDDITKQFPEIINFIKENFPDKDFVMDSECVGYDYEKSKFLPFQMLSKRILTKDINSVNQIKIVVKAFDLLKLDKQTLIDEPYEKRRYELENLFVNKPIKEKIKFDLNKLKEIK